MSTFSAKYHLILKTKGWWASQVVLMVKKPLANAGDIRDEGSVPGSGRSPGGESGNPVFLPGESHRGSWRATIQGVIKSRTRLSDLACTHQRVVIILMLQRRKLRAREAKTLGQGHRAGLLQSLDPWRQSCRCVCAQPMWHCPAMTRTLAHLTLPTLPPSAKPLLPLHTIRTHTPSCGTVHFTRMGKSVVGVWLFSVLESQRPSALLPQAPLYPSALTVCCRGPDVMRIKHRDSKLTKRRQDLAGCFTVMCTKACAKSLQLCPALCNPMECSPPDPSVHGILQARILEWAAMPSSTGCISIHIGKSSKV